MKHAHLSKTKKKNSSKLQDHITITISKLWSQTALRQIASEAPKRKLSLLLAINPSTSSRQKTEQSDPFDRSPEWVLRLGITWSMACAFCQIIRKYLRYIRPGIMTGHKTTQNISFIQPWVSRKLYGVEFCSVMGYRHLTVDHFKVNLRRVVKSCLSWWIEVMIQLSGMTFRNFIFCWILWIEQFCNFVAKLKAFQKPRQGPFAYLMLVRNKFPFLFTLNHSYYGAWIGPCEVPCAAIDSANESRLFLEGGRQQG